MIYRPVRKKEIRMLEAKKLFDKIEEKEQEYIRFWRDLCEIESPTYYKEGVDAVADLIIEKASHYGMQVDRHHFERAGDTCTITLNPEAKKKPICLSAHMDTVFKQGAFSSPRTRIEGDTIYGPGVTDDKGGLAAALHTMAVLAECGFKDRPVKLIMQCDEENSSIATGLQSIDYMYEQAKNCLCFFNLEWYRYGQAILWRKGSFTTLVKVYGKTYVSKRCFLGHSALAQACFMICELEKYKQPDGLCCNVGYIKAGEYGDTEMNVPDYCEFAFDLSYMTAQEYESVIKQINDMCSNPIIEGTRCEYELKGGFPNMEKRQDNFELLEKMNRIYRELGMKQLEATWSHGGSDASRMNQKGITTIDSLGVHGLYIHTLDEQADISSLKDAARRLSTVIAYIED